MKYDNLTLAGALLFIGSVQCLLGMLIAESFYPGYSVSENYISDLGVGTTAIIFNTSVFLFGACAVACAYFIYHAFGSKLLSMLLTLTGIGAMGVGLFPENFGVIHGIASLITFLFGSLSVLMSYRLLKSPSSYLSILLGAMSLVALVLFGSGTYLGLGRGGMERMIAYPALLWGVGFGGYLMNSSNEKGAFEKS